MRSVEGVCPLVEEGLGDDPTGIGGTVNQGGLWPNSTARTAITST